MDEANVKEETKNEECEEDEEYNVKDEAKEAGGVGDGELRKCTFCDFTASTVREMRKHKKDMHREMLQVIHCDQCSFVSHWKDSMTLHRKHHDMPAEWSNVKCKHCDYVCSRSDYLLRHTKSIHQDLRYPCNLCEYQATRKQYLESHIKKIHSKVKTHLNK